jgi:hypothetical protein
MKEANKSYSRRTNYHIDGANHQEELIPLTREQEEQASTTREVARLAEQRQHFFRTMTHRQQGQPSVHADTASSNERENEGTAISLHNNEPVSNIECCADRGAVQVDELSASITSGDGGGGSRTSATKCIPTKNSHLPGIKMLMIPQMFRLRVGKVMHELRDRLNSKKLPISMINTILPSYGHQHSIYGLHQHFQKRLLLTLTICYHYFVAYLYSCMTNTCRIFCQKGKCHVNGTAGTIAV